VVTTLDYVILMSRVRVRVGITRTGNTYSSLVHTVRNSIEDMEVEDLRDN
jgi:hypothetical protein